MWKICNQMMTTCQYKEFNSVQRLLKKNHQRTKSLEVQKIRKSVKDEKIKSYYKPLLFVNTMFSIYSIKCLVDLWRSQTSNIIVK
jgi:hypothetical protein